MKKKIEKITSTLERGPIGSVRRVYSEDIVDKINEIVDYLSETGTHHSEDGITTLYERSKRK